jgi:sigma-B regulation protein RsbU (phosphoserine phosphatase)
MNQNATVEATEFLPALKANIDEFVGEAPQFDDITMLCLDYFGPGREQKEENPED